MERMSEKLPVLSKLEEGGDFFAWKVEIQTYFESIGLWDHVLNGAEIITEEEEDADAEMVAAKCRRIILHSLERDVSATVRHLQSAHEMYLRLKKLFVGTPTAAIRSLRKKLSNVRFQGCFRSYLTEYSNAVMLLKSEGGILSYKLLADGMLQGLPKMLSPITQPLMRRIDETEADTEQIWTFCFDKILEYCIDTGLYSFRKKQDFSGSAQGAVSQKQPRKKKKMRCWNCGKLGHARRDCPEPWKEKPGKSENAWGASSLRQVQEEGAVHSMILDSGASQHSCGKRFLFDKIEKLAKPVILHTANGVVEVKETGTLTLNLLNGQKFVLKEVLLWPEAPLLFSVGKLIEHGFWVDFKKTGAKIFAGRTLVYNALKGKDGVYHVEFTSEKREQSCFVLDKNLETRIWHARLNHCSERRLSRMLDKDVKLNSICESCCQGKSRRKQVKKKSTSREEKDVLQVLHADVVGPLKESVNRKLGALVVCDARSNFLWFEPLRTKSEVPDLLQGLLTRLERMFPGAVKFLRTDNGTEFTNKKVLQFLNKLGIQHQKTQAYVHAENGRIENWNRVVFENIRTLLVQANLSAGWWPYAGQFAVYVHNRMLPTNEEKLSPWEVVYGQKPDLKHLRIFGCPGFAHVEVEQRSKLQNTSVPVVLLGYGRFREGYQVMDKSISSFSSTSKSAFSSAVKDRVKKTLLDDLSITW